MRQVSVQSRSSPYTRHSALIHALVLPILLAVAAPAGAQILETETARIPLPGRLEVGTGYEYQTSTAGTEHAIPVAVELGVTNRFSLLVEPVLYTTIRTKNGPNATGVGDVEVTGTLLALQLGVSGGTTTGTPRPSVLLPATIITPEAATGEIVGTLGAGRYVLQNTLLSLSVSYDNSNATLIRPGITVTF